MIYENSGKDIGKVYRVFSCVVYTPIDNYVCIDYMLCQLKKICSILRNLAFKETSFNLLLGIGFTELLLNLVYCHGFMMKSNSTVILNCRLRLINIHLSKLIFIIEHGFKQLNLIPNDVRLRINLVDQPKTDYVMVKNEALSAVANTIKQLHNNKNIHMTYKQDFYKTIESEIDGLFLEYLAPVMKDLDHPALIKEWIQNLDAAAYEKIYTKMKSYHQQRRKFIVIIKQNVGQK